MESSTLFRSRVFGHNCDVTKKTVRAVQRLLGLMTVLLYAGLAVSSAGSVTLDAVTTKRIDSLFSACNSLSSPGVAVGVFRNGETLFNASYGMADIGNGIPIGDSTEFYIGSMAKQFTAYAILVLVREGQIDLDSNIARYLPSCTEVYRPITTRHLLYHTSGVRDFITLAHYAGVRRGLDYLSPADIDRIIFAQKQLDFQPGQRFRYSNSNYWLLARIIEYVSGVTFSEYVQESVFEPLGMEQSCFTSDMRLVIAHRAQGYALSDDSVWICSAPAYSTHGAGGMFTNLSDLAKWDRVFYQTSAAAFNIIDTMLSPFQLNNGKLTGEGAGLITSDYRGKTVEHHSGNTIGFGCEMLRFPDDTITVAVLFNTERRWADPSFYAHRLADIVVFHDSVVAIAQLDDAEAAEPTEQERGTNVWQGLYLLEDGTTVTLANSGDRVGLSVDGGRLISAEILGDSLMAVESRGWRIHRLDTAMTGENDTLQFTIGKGEDARSYPLFRPLPVSPSESADFTGQFYSKEIDALWLVEAADGSLRIANGHNRGRPFIAEKLYRYSSTSFTDGSLGYYTFERAADGAVTGIELSEPRLHELRLDKIAE